MQSLSKEMQSLSKEIQSLSKEIRSLPKEIQSLSKEIITLQTITRDRLSPPPPSNATIPPPYPTNIAVSPAEMIDRAGLNDPTSSPYLSQVIPFIPAAPPNPAVALRRRLLQNAVLRRPAERRPARRRLRRVTIQSSSSSNS